MGTGEGGTVKLRHVGALIAGCGIDAVLGDPAGWPHPVRIIGKQIEREEEYLRTNLLPLAQDESWPLDEAETEQAAGAVLAATVMAALPAAAWAGLKLAERVHPAVAFAAETVLFYQLVATRALRDESMAVYKPLSQGDVEQARAMVARIVGRDTDELDEECIARATVETIAENTSDGVIAPMMYQALLVQDMFLAGSFLLIVSVMVCLGSLISDILLSLIDPRIRFGAGVE